MIYLLIILNLIVQEKELALLNLEQSRSLEINNVLLRDIIYPKNSFAELIKTADFEVISKTESFTATRWIISWGKSKLEYVDRNGYPELHYLELPISYATKTIQINNIKVTSHLLNQSKADVSTNNKILDSKRIYLIDGLSQEEIQSYYKNNHRVFFSINSKTKEVVALKIEGPDSL